MTDKINITASMISAALSGGREIMPFWERRDFEKTTKKDNTPVTSADLASSAAICEILSSAYPEIPILCEEEDDIMDDGVPVRIRCGRCFIVDPLDGTRPFIDHSDEFAVSIAYAEENHPEVGVIYAPAKGLLYYGARGLGAFKRKIGEEFDMSDLFAGTPLKASKRTEELAALRSRTEDEAAQALYARLGGLISEIRCVNSCLKGCYIAEGAADIYCLFAPYTKEWDTAAEQIIAEEAGAVVTDAYGGRLSVNREDVRNKRGIMIVNRIESSPYFDTVSTN